MTKKDILKMETIAYYSGFNGLEIKGIEYGIDDHVLCVSGAWNGKPKPHGLKYKRGIVIYDYTKGAI